MDEESTSMLNLTDKTALVTGSAQGIGFGIALELARAGSRVVIADLNHEKARAAAQEIAKAGQETLAVILDVTDEASVNACVQASIERFSRIDILVNNAGIHCEKIGQLS